jgi:hypothetical protein
VVPLSPYRPLELRAEVPCATLRALDASPGGGEALRTLPADVDPTLGAGLVVKAANGAVSISSSARDLLTEPIPAGDCTYAVVADGDATQVLRDGTLLQLGRGLLPPQVAEFETAAEGIPEAAGLAVTLHTDARYESSPSTLKIILLVAHLVAFVALLVLAWRTWPGRGPRAVKPRPSSADAVVLVVSAAWAVLGPVNIDDSWYALMARNAAASGSMGNYIYQFNVTENPFSASQYPMQLLGAIGGWGLLWLRVLPLLYGLLTYVLLRFLLAGALGRVGRRPGVPWALAVAHLLWFCAYGITLRPETAIVVCSAAVLLLADIARRRESLGALMVAIAVGSLAMTVSPTALVAVVPVVVCLPWLWRWLRKSGWVERIATLLVACGAASVVVPVGFWDATLGDVLESFGVHRWYYRQHPWYDEFVHYANLLEQADTGAWGKRLPVLLTIAVLLIALAGAARGRGTGGAMARSLSSTALVTGLGFVAMSATPTKWVNHFGAIAGPATLLLALALLRTPLPRRAGWRAVVPAAMIVGGAAAVSFAGPNLWRPFSDWGQAFGNHAEIGSPYQISQTTPHFGPIELRNPVLWVLVAFAGLWWVRRLRRAGRPTGLTPERTLLGTALVGGLALMLLVFTLAPIRQAPGPSVASMNLAALTGNSCGLANSARALAPSVIQLGAAEGPAELGGDMVEGVPPARTAPTGSSGPVWNTDVPDGSGVGSVTTPWFALPSGTADKTVVVPATGDLRQGQSVSVGLRGERPDGSVETREITFDPLGDKQADWADFRLDVPGLNLSFVPDAVRVGADDTLAGPDTWLGVAAPYLAEEKTVPELVGNAPVFADQTSAVLWSCVDQITVEHGLAEAPQWRLRAGDGLEGAVKDNSVFVPNGGTLAAVNRTARFVELPSSLEPAGGVAALPWGHVERVVYDHPVGAYDLTIGRQTRQSWTRFDTLVGKDYTGRDYIG